jgi:hypothetical protein
VVASFPTPGLPVPGISRRKAHLLRGFNPSTERMGQAPSFPEYFPQFFAKDG